METNSAEKNEKIVVDGKNLEGEHLIKWMPWENQLGSAFDNCCTDALIKGTAGMVTGIITSALLTRRRTWPIFLGTGFGVGLAYTGCEKYVKSLYGRGTEES